MSTPNLPPPRAGQRDRAGLRLDLQMKHHKLVTSPGETPPRRLALGGCGSAHAAAVEPGAGTPDP